MTMAVDYYVQQLNDAILDAGKEAGIYQKKYLKPKSYWYPELCRLRDKKRFWWTLYPIWVQNGKLRNGDVFECWKKVKKDFRCLSTKFIQNQTEAHFAKLNSLHYSRKSSLLVSGII